MHFCGMLIYYFHLCQCSVISTSETYIVIYVETYIFLSYFYTFRAIEPIYLTYYNTYWEVYFCSPRGETGRPVSGVVRPGTQYGRASSLEAALKTPRTARSARPSTSQSARTVRLGTASMMSQPDGPFIQVNLILIYTNQMLNSLYINKYRYIIIYFK